MSLANGYSVFMGVGERTREGNDLYYEMQEKFFRFQKNYVKSIDFRQTSNYTDLRKT